MEYNTDNADNFVSLKTLKSNMREALKKSGVLSSVKAQVRREFISNLAPGNMMEQTQQGEVAEQELLFRSVVFHFLKSRQWEYSLSVYSAECGVDAKTLLSESAVASKLHLPQEKLQSPARTAIEIVMQELQRRAEVTLVDSGTQSDYSGVGIREMLDAQLSAIDRTYESKKEQEKLFPSRGIEEKMAVFQRDLEKRMQLDFDSRVDSMREVEIAKVRLDEAHKARLELEMMRTQMEASFERRMVVQAEREAESLRGASERERQLQQAQYEARQRLQRELDDLRNREQSASKKLELDNQGLRLLESRLREVQGSLESKEKELGRREREAELAVKNAAEQAREEARDRLREELEALLRERAGLRTERIRLDADREAWESVVADAAGWRSKCTALETELTKKEEEIITLRHHVTRLDFRQKLEINEIAELTGMTSLQGSNGVDLTEAMLSDPFSNSAKSVRTQHLIGLIQRNAEIDARVKLLEDLNRESKSLLKHERELRAQAESQLREKQQELDRVMNFSKEFTIRVENERRRAQKEIEKLRRICAVEKGRVAVAVNQRSEIEHLVHEQREAISHLQKSNRSMGHVKNIRDHIDSTEEDTPVKRNLSGSNSTSAMKMHSDMAVELDWLKRRREAIEQVEGDRAAIQQTAHNPGSFIYGHNLVPDTISQVSSGNSAHIGNYTFSPTDQSHSATGDTLNFDRRQREIIVLREEERRRREQEELERMKHEQELQRVKDLLRKQREENEIDELRRSSEEFAEKLKIKREQELADKEEELRKREADLVRQREADRLMGDQRALEALRIARENRSKINKAFDIEARRQSFDAEKLEAEAEAVAAVERAVMKQQQEAFAISTTRQKEVDDEFERARVAEEQERGTEAKKLEEQLQAQRQQNEAESRLREEREKVEAQEAAKIAARKIQESASALLEKFRQQDFDEAYMKSNQDEVDETVQKAKDAETENCRKLEEEKEAEVERIRILNKRAEESLRAQRKLEADEKAQENERQKLAMEKSIAAKEEANRLRQLAEEEEEREAAANAAAAEEERLQAVEQALAEEHRKLEASRAAEEANKKKEDDSNALQAARAKVLARRKQKQERDSVESLISEGNASIRNSQTELPIQDVPKPEENMSIISEIEVQKTADHSDDDDIWF